MNVEELKQARDFALAADRQEIKNPVPGRIEHMTAEILREVIAAIEAEDMGVNAVVMDAKTYAELRKYSRNELKIATQAKVLCTGMLGFVDGIPIFVSREAASNRIILSSSRGDDARKTVFGYDFKRKEPVSLDVLNDKLDWIIEHLGDQ